jgi:curved DNA-binding protein
MPHLGQPQQRGDLYARVKLVLPEPLTDDELATLRTLAQARQQRYG